MMMSIPGYEVGNKGGIGCLQLLSGSCEGLW